VLTIQTVTEPYVSSLFLRSCIWLCLERSYLSSSLFGPSVWLDIYVWVLVGFIDNLVNSCIRYSLVLLPPIPFLYDPCGQIRIRLPIDPAASAQFGTQLVLYLSESEGLSMPLHVMDGCTFSAHVLKHGFFQGVMSLAQSLLLFSTKKWLRLIPGCGVVGYAFITELKSSSFLVFSRFKIARGEAPPCWVMDRLPPRGTWWVLF
jgi:hypothetical protein